jgi:hypothetical protein
MILCVLTLATATLLFSGGDGTFVNPWRVPSRPPERLPADVNLPVLPEIQKQVTEASVKKTDRPERLQPMSRLEIIRYVSGEFARAKRVLPSGKDGFRWKVGEPVNERQLSQLAANHGAAGNPGDMVQITRIEFKDKEIILDINGGGKKRRSWRERLQISVGGLPTVTTTNPNQAAGYQGVGSTLIVDFGRPLPDMTAEELKELLGEFLEFSPRQSAAVLWVETLPEEFQQAIREKRVVVGMDRDMVVAAIGKPTRKVRERRPADGVETEDWIYGQPPGETIFVTFVGDKVVEVKQFPK